MIHNEEFRCTQETAMTIKEKHPTNPSWHDPNLTAALGIPVVVSADVPEGKLQFWQDGKMIREIDV